MAEANNASDHSLLWGHALEFWDRAGIVSLIVGAVVGVIALLLTAASAYILYRVADTAQLELVAETKRSSEGLAAVGLETAKAKAELGVAQADIAKAQAAAAKANLEAAQLRLELEWEVQKRAPRTLEAEKAKAFSAAIEGKFPFITVYVEAGAETRRFADQIEQAISAAHIPIHEKPITANPTLPWAVANRTLPLSPLVNGVLMYAPGFTGNSAELVNDPLYLALKAGGIYSGAFVGSNIIDGFDPNEYAIYVGEKAPW